MEGILGQDGAQAHNAAFAILLMLSGMLLTSSAGWFVGNARMAWAARKLADASRWARDGAVKVAAPAAAAGAVAMSPAAFAATPYPAPLAVTVPAPASIRYGAPLATVPTVTVADRARADTPGCAHASTPDPVNCAHASTPATAQRADADTGRPRPARAKASRSQHAPRQARVEDGQKLDTGTEGRSASRYQRVRAAVVAGTLKPSVRAVQAAEGGGTVVVRRYLQTMVDEGLLARTASGYELMRRPAHPNQIELAL